MKYLLCKKFAALTLIEAMIAVVILGFASIAVVLPFTSGATLAAEGSCRTLAANLASDLMERIINTPFDQILPNYGNYQENQGQMIKINGSYFTGNSYSRFSRTSTCVNWPQDYPIENLLLITVKIYYGGQEIAEVQRLKGR